MGGHEEAREVLEAAEKTLVVALQAARTRPPAMQRLLQSNLARVRKGQPLRDE